MLGKTMRSQILAYKINELLSSYGEASVISILRQAKMPDRLAPKLIERCPFSSLSDEAIINFLLYAKEYPWGLGILTQTLYHFLKIYRSCPTEFIIIESHIDLPGKAKEDEDAFISMGFEPDHFKTLNPPEYDLCYTLRWEIPKDWWKRMNHIQVKNYVVEVTKKACATIEKRNYPAYAEVEIYSHAGKKVFENIDVEKGEISDFPYSSNDFIQVASNPSIFKKADVHIKIPVYKGIAQHKLDKLTSLFINAGFYEIVSKSGNKIFTVQCIFQEDAVAAFQQLNLWSKKSNLVSSINHETCLYFWRHQWKENDEYIVSPIPKVVRRNALQ
jgi:hypothetical protein